MKISIENTSFNTKKALKPCDSLSKLCGFSILQSQKQDVNESR